MKSYNEFSVYKELDLNDMGKRIRERREFLGLSRESLAGKVGVSSKFISDIEYGSKGISIKRLYILCQALDSSVDYILGGLNEDNELGEGERSEINARILHYLQDCNNDQLRCFERMSENYAQGIKISSNKIK